MEADRHNFWEEERQCFEKAVELDPTFAMAYLGLSLANRTLGNTPKKRISTISWVGTIRVEIKRKLSKNTTKRWNWIPTMKEL